MTQEQKAKAYDEALEWMRKIYPTLTGANKEDAEHYFPELKESEDEKTRKTIIRILQVGGFMSLEEKNKAFAWLEKQKEQKPSINIEQLKSLMLQYFQEAANEKNDSDIQADTDKWARKILGHNFEQKEQTFESVWHKEECQRIIDEGQGLTPRFKDLFKEVCKAFYEAGAEAITNQRVSLGYLISWYIQSVDGHSPIWTEEHLKELDKDFILIPKPLTNY